MTKPEYYIFIRLATSDAPAGFTISKRSKLPKCDFRIIEYSWPDLTLCFIEDDGFTYDERQAIYHHIKEEVFP